MEADGNSRTPGCGRPDDPVAALNRELEGLLDAILEPAGWPRICSTLNQILDARLILLTFGPDGRHDARFCDRAVAEPVLVHLARSQVESGKSIIAYMLHDADQLTFHCKRKISSPAQSPAPAPPEAQDDLRSKKALMSRIYDRNGQKALLAAFREAPQAPFGTQELCLIELLSRRLNLALDCAARIGEARQQAGQMRLMLQSGSHLSLLIDSTRRIVTSCGTTLDELGLNDLVEVRAGRLNILAKELEEKLDPLLDRLTPGLLFGSGRSAKRETDLSRPQELVLITQSGTPCRIVMTVTGQEGQEGASHVLIRIHLPRNLPEEIGTALQAVYGLSKSEARLAFFLVVSGSLTDTLDSLSVTRNTAKTHLRRIYEKTGTRSQLELAQVIFRLASLYP